LGMDGVKVDKAVIRQRILERDRYECVFCRRTAGVLHHIVPRSRFNSHNAKNQALLWDDRNLCMLCVRCDHGDKDVPDAHTRGRRIEALEILGERYGYDYSAPPWNEYVEGGE